MSAFAFLTDRRGAPLDRRALAGMAAALEHRGPDGRRELYFPAAGLVHLHFWTTPEEIGERQPLSHASGRFHVLFDGRIDNRGELMRLLDERASDSDAALLARGYARLGEDVFARLLGPFAAAIYDSSTGRVVLARDALGDRTLFYHLKGELLAVASEESAVLAHPAVSTGLDEGRLAAYFALRAPPAGATFFADVRELAPAHLMTVERGRVETRRYWAPGLETRPAAASDGEWAERWRALLDESVACRLRAPSTPAVLMSGGLDSSSVAVLAARRLAAAADPARLVAVSYVFDELESCDERRFIAMTRAACGLDAIEVVGDGDWPLANLEERPFNPNTPEENLYRGLKERAYRAAAGAGRRVLLTGWFGDQLCSAAPYWLHDLVAEGRFIRAGRDLLWHLREEGVKRLLAGPALRRLVRAAGRAPKPRWLTEHAASLLSDPRDAGDPAGGARPEQAESLLGLFAAHDASAEIFHASRCGVEQRHPYRDRRMIELMLAAPAYLSYERGLLKPILREAMKGILPEGIRTRRRPTSLHALWRRKCVEREAATLERIIGRPDAAWRRYVRPDWMAEAPAGRRSAEAEELVLWQCACLELWSARRESGSGLRAA